MGEPQISKLSSSMIIRLLRVIFLFDKFNRHCSATNRSRCQSLKSALAKQITYMISDFYGLYSLFVVFFTLNSCLVFCCCCCSTFPFSDKLSHQSRQHDLHLKKECEGAKCLQNFLVFIMRQLIFSLHSDAGLRSISPCRSPSGLIF